MIQMPPKRVPEKKATKKVNRKKRNYGANGEYNFIILSKVCMIAFGSEKEISFRILLIIKKKRGSGTVPRNLSAARLFQIHLMEDYGFLPVFELLSGYIQLLRLTGDFFHVKVEFCSKSVSNVDDILNFPRTKFTTTK